MKIRIGLLLLALLLAAAACGGGDDDNGGTTGPTGAGGTDELAKFTAVAQDTEGGNTLSISGVSCDGTAGPYDVTVAMQGNSTGETTSTLQLTDGQGTLEFSMDVTGAEEGTISATYAVELSPLQDVDVFVFSGVTTIEGASGQRSFQVETGDIPIDVGTGTCPS